MVAIGLVLQGLDRLGEVALAAIEVICGVNLRLNSGGIWKVGSD